MKGGDVVGVGVIVIIAAEGEVVGDAADDGGLILVVVTNLGMR